MLSMPLVMNSQYRFWLNMYVEWHSFPTVSTTLNNFLIYFFLTSTAKKKKNRPVCLFFVPVIASEIYFTYEAEVFYKDIIEGLS